MNEATTSITDEYVQGQLAASRVSTVMTVHPGSNDATPDAGAGA